MGVSVSFTRYFQHVVKTMGAGASAAKDKREAVLEAFKAVDKSGDDKISKDEVKEFLQKQDDQVFTDEVCDELYKQANSNGDDGITVAEFTAWLEKAEAENAEAPAEEE